MRTASICTLAHNHVVGTNVTRIQRQTIRNNETEKEK